MRRLDYLKKLWRELEEAQEILDWAKGNMRNVMFGPVEGAGSHDGNVDLLCQAEMALEGVVNNLSHLTYGYLKEEVTDDITPVEEEVCPHCGANIGVYLEMVGGSHNHYDEDGKLIYQRPIVEVTS